MSINSISSAAPVATPTATLGASASCTGNLTVGASISPGDTAASSESSIVKFSEESIAKLEDSISHAAASVRDSVKEGTQYVEDTVSHGYHAVADELSSIGQSISHAASSTAAYLGFGSSDGKSNVNETV